MNMTDEMAIIYDGTYNDDMDLIVTDCIIPIAEKRRNKVTISGRDGDLYEDTGNYEDIKINVGMAFLSRDAYTWRNAFVAAKRWILSGDDRLEISYMHNGFYKVKNAVISESERFVYDAGTFTAVFTCDPYQYLRSGQISRAIESVKNFYQPCNPVYTFTGEGVLTFTVNGNSITANVGQNLTIDTDLMQCYRTSDGGKTLVNSTVSGATLEKLRLAAGDNTLSYSGGLTGTMLPNWRIL